MFWKSNEMCLLLGATGVGKTLLLKRLHKLTGDGSAELGEPPVTLPTPYAKPVVSNIGVKFDNALKLDKQVGTNLTDVTLKKKRVTVRELGGCMGPIWPSYFNDCSCVIFMVDSANISQVSSSCIQLLSVLAAKPLQTASVLVIFNKRDLPCTMSLVEVKSLFRMDDIVASATQPITTLELSARSGQGLQEVLAWLDAAVTK